MKEKLITIAHLPIILLMSPFIISWEVKRWRLLNYLKKNSKFILTPEETDEFKIICKSTKFNQVTYLVQKAVALEESGKKVDKIYWEKLYFISSMTKSRDNILACSPYVNIN